MAEAGIAKVKDRDVWLIGGTCSEITGSKLPSNCQVLARFLHLHLNDKHTIQDSAVSTTRELLQFWMKARIPTRQNYNIVVKLKDLHGKWKALKKGASNMSFNQRSKEAAFVDSLDDLFDVAHAMKLINIEEDRKFLGHKGKRVEEGAWVQWTQSYHRARWMAKLIYCLKIYLYRFQFRLTRREL